MPRNLFAAADLALEQGKIHLSDYAVLAGIACPKLIKKELERRIYRCEQEGAARLSETMQSVIQQQRSARAFGLKTLFTHFFDHAWVCHIEGYATMHPVSFPAALLAAVFEGGTMEFVGKA